MFLMADANSARDVEASDAGPTRVILVARTRQSTKKNEGVNLLKHGPHAGPTCRNKEGVTKKTRESVYSNAGVTRVLVAA